VGFFATIVLHDYVAAILNTPRTGSNWYLDLGAEIKNGNARVECGTGNVVSVEFAVLYHWHAALSDADAKWMDKVLKDQLPKLGLKSIKDITAETFPKILWGLAKPLTQTECKNWVFGGMERGPDGRFDDVKIAELIKDCIEEPAHAFGAHGSPSSMKYVEILGMLQAREKFNVCTLNE